MSIDDVKNVIDDSASFNGYVDDSHFEEYMVKNYSEFEKNVAKEMLKLEEKAGNLDDIYRRSKSTDNWMMKLAGKRTNHYGFLKMSQNNVEKTLTRRQLRKKLMALEFIDKNAKLDILLDVVFMAVKEGYSFIDIYQRSLLIDSDHPIDVDDPSIDLGDRASQCLKDCMDLFIYRANQKDAPKALTRALKEGSEIMLDFTREAIKMDASPESQLYKHLEMFKSNNDAIEQFKISIAKYQDSLDKQSGKDNSSNLKDSLFKKPIIIPVPVLVDMLINFYPMTCTSGQGNEEGSLLFYDYSLGRFSSSEKTIRALAAYAGVFGKNAVNDLLNGIRARSSELFPFIEAPDYLIKCKNGIYNLMTRKFIEEEKIFYVFTTSIDCNYIPFKANNPAITKGFDLHRLIDDLANHNSARARLLSQICKSLMTGVLPSPAIFFICGQGGDGKSLFFDVMTDIIGQNNVARANLSDLERDDKILGMADARCTMGSDNVNGIYLKSSLDLLKSTATQDNWTFSRKYKTALYAKLKTIMVQLCNEMPRFAEQGIQMERRIVTVKAENSHTLNGDEVRNLTSIIKSEEFKEIIFSQILNAEEVPYYSDFEDVDRETTRNVLRQDDTIKRYFSYLNSNSLFDGSADIIPLRLLYAGYVAWCEKNNIEKMLSSRSFHSKSAQTMAQLGYTKSKAKSQRVKSLLECYSIDIDSYGESSKDQALINELEKNVASSFYELKPGHTPDTSFLDKEFRRDSKETSVYEYFNMYEPIRNAIDSNQITAYSHYKELALYLYYFGKGRTINDLLPDLEDRTYIDLDQMLEAKIVGFESYETAVLKPRLLKQQELARKVEAYRDGKIKLDQIDDPAFRRAAMNNNVHQGQIDQMAMMKMLAKLTGKNPESSNLSKLLLTDQDKEFLKQKHEKFSFSSVPFTMADVRKAVENQSKLDQGSCSYSNEPVKDQALVALQLLTDLESSTKFNKYYKNAFREYLKHNKSLQFNEIKSFLSVVEEIYPQMKPLGVFEERTAIENILVSMPNDMLRECSYFTKHYDGKYDKDSYGVIVEKLKDIDYISDMKSKVTALQQVLDQIEALIYSVRRK